MNTNELLKQINFELDDLQAIDVNVLDVQELTSVTDYMVICSGRSTRHVKSLADNLIEKLKKQQVKALSQSGIDAGEWALIDYGDIVVHVMLPDIRAFYNLEGLWDSKTE